MAARDADRGLHADARPGTASAAHGQGAGPQVRVLIPSGALGISIDPAALEAGLAMAPDIIAIDGGSTDSGPYYLGTGTCKYARASIKREWAMLMRARARLGVPLLIGTAGTCGVDAMVDWMLEITAEIAAEIAADDPAGVGAALRVATLKSSQYPATLAEQFGHGAISALEGAPDLAAADFAGCSHAVALAGAEQIQVALETRADIIIAGRATDTAVIAALPLARGCHPG
ncbi:MAG: acyclic terpene utilization AtuA family protein, partial [Alphaproteobacteria bacterium]